MLDLVLAVAAGALIGLSLGALGGGSSILTVQVLVYALGQSPAQATTGSLVVVGVTALTGAVAAHRAGNIMLGRGVAHLVDPDLIRPGWELTIPGTAPVQHDPVEPPRRSQAARRRQTSS